MSEPSDIQVAVEAERARLAKALRDDWRVNDLGHESLWRSGVRWAASVIEGSIEAETRRPS